MTLQVIPIPLLDYTYSKAAARLDTDRLPCICLYRLPAGYLPCSVVLTLGNTMCFCHVMISYLLSERTTNHCTYIMVLTRVGGHMRERGSEAVREQRCISQAIF